MNEKTIGALAKFTGVSVHTIKYYEKIGLLSSNRKENSNYRSYNMRACTDIYECMKYRNLDFSLKDIGVLLRDADSKVLDEMLTKREQELEDQIQKLMLQKEKVANYHKELKNVDECLNKWYVEEMPHLYIKEQTDLLDYRKDGALEDVEVNLMEMAPNCKNVVTIDKDYLNGGDEYFSWGMGLLRDEPDNELEKAGFKHIEAGRAFVVYLRFHGPYVSNGEMTKVLREIYSQNKNEFPSSAYGMRLKIIHDETGEDWNYFKVYIPLN